MSLVPISAVVITHNHASFIGRCLETLLPEIDTLGGEVIVIDNRSDDDSADIARCYPQVVVRVNERRLGFAANANQGMALAKGEYVLLLNPDTRVTSGVLGTLLAFMAEHPEAGMCGPRLVYPHGGLQPSARRFPTVASVVARRTPLRIFLRNTVANKRHLMLSADHTRVQEVDWLLGACLLVRYFTIMDVGPLDEAFPLYVEDIDWARRMHLAGWKVYYVPDALVVHDHLAISDKHLFSRETWLHTRSMIHYARKYLLAGLPLVSVRQCDITVWNSMREERPLFPSADS